jgi:hypothetical protein
MPAATGTLTIQDLLATTYANANDVGLDRINDAIQAELARHNAEVDQMVRELAMPTTERLMAYGGNAQMTMQQLDEFGRVETQKVTTGTTVGFPLHLFGVGVGWTAKWFQSHTPAEMARQLLATEAAHLRGIRLQFQRALFLATNYTVRDYLIDNVSLAVKRLVNADSADIPNGPNFETFDSSTHTHYNWSDGLTTTAATALIDDVVEHGHGAMVKVYINRADEADWRALEGFEPYVDPRIIYRSSDTPGQTLDITRLDNRAIGIYGAAEIWVKSWVPDNYAFAFDQGSGEKPLAFRQRDVTSLQGLRLAAEFDTHPLHARQLEAEFGVGVWTRTNGAVLYYADSATEYVEPTLS